MPSALPSGFVPAERGTPSSIARSAVDWWTVAGGPDAILPYAEQAIRGYQSDSPAFRDYGTGVDGGAQQATYGGDLGGGSSPYGSGSIPPRSNSSAGGRDAQSPSSSADGAGLVGLSGPAASSGGSGPSTSGAGLNAFGDIFIGGAPRVARVAEAEESATTYRYLSLAALGMVGVGGLIFLLRK